MTPLRHTTIPRLELAAATVSAKMSDFVRNELEYKEICEFFWTDSQAVLGYCDGSISRPKIPVTRLNTTQRRVVSFCFNPTSTLTLRGTGTQAFPKGGTVATLPPSLKDTVLVARSL